MIEINCSEWIENLASKSPTPGGGGAAALVGAIGAALGAMVGNLTIGKKKYSMIESELKEWIAEIGVLSEKLQDMVEADAMAFLPLSKAYRMPFTTEAEKNAKETAIQIALVEATEVPLQVMELCNQVLYFLDKFAKNGSHLALSDAGCGAVCCLAAIRSARLNVLINLNLMENQEAKGIYQVEMEHSVEVGEKLSDEIYQYVEGNL